MSSVCRQPERKLDVACGQGLGTFMRAAWNAGAHTWCINSGAVRIAKSLSRSVLLEPAS